MKSQSDPAVHRHFFQISNEILVGCRHLNLFPMIVLLLLPLSHSYMSDWKPQRHRTLTNQIRVLHHPKNNFLSQSNFGVSPSIREEKESNSAKKYFSRLSNLVSRFVSPVALASARKDLLQQCYGKYGCFSIDYPWFSSHRVVQMLPKGPLQIWPEFHLFSRRNPFQHQKLSEGNFELLQKSFFDPTK